jgi:type I restriction enzyme M protein
MTDKLEPKPGEAIYDPTCVSAGMLLSVVDHLNAGRKNGVTFASTARNATFSRPHGRMNLFLHGSRTSGLFEATP